jgi:hypothetical protein
VIFLLHEPRSPWSRAQPATDHRGHWALPRRRRAEAHLFPCGGPYADHQAARATRLVADTRGRLLPMLGLESPLIALRPAALAATGTIGNVAHARPRLLWVRL